MNLAILEQPPTKFSMDHAGVAGKLMEDSHGFFRVGPEGRDWQRLPQSSLYVAVVADGSSQHMSGANASHLALQTIERVMQQQPADMPVHQRIDESIRFAHQTILEAIYNNPSLRGMSTTLSMAVIDGWRLYIAYVGNSRICLIREGKLYPLTLDPSEKIATSTDQHLVEGTNWHLSANHVSTRQLGMEKPLQVEHLIVLPGNGSAESLRKESSLELLPGDIVLLCTDGLSNAVSEQEIASAFQVQQPKHAVRQLMSMALDNRQEDNLTAAVLVMPQTDRRTWASPRVIDVGALLISAILALLLLVGAAWSGIAIGKANGWKQVENFAQSILTDTNTSADSALSENVAMITTAAETQTVTLPTAVPSVAIGNSVAVNDAISETTPSAIAAAMPVTTSEVTTSEVMASDEVKSDVVTSTSASTSTLAVPLSSSVSVGAVAEPPITTSVPITESAAISPLVAAVSDTIEANIANSSLASSESETPTLASTVVPSIELSPSLTLPAPVAVDSLLTVMGDGGSSDTGSQFDTAVPVDDTSSVALPKVTDTPTAQNAELLTPTATFAPSPTPTALVLPTIKLLEPMETTLSDSRTFSWKSETELPPNYNYELIFWEAGQDPLANGFSPVGAARATSVRVDLNTAALGTLQGVLMPGRLYQWGVVLVDAAQTHRRVVLLASGPQFLFKLADNSAKPAAPTAAPTNTPVPPPSDTPVPPPPADTPVPPTATNVPGPTATEDCPRTDPNCKTTGSGTN